MAGKGGKRPGAGRKKLGVNQLRAEAAIAVKWTGQTPAEFFKQVMDDESQPMSLRLDAAKAGAPLVHRKQPQEQEISTVEPMQVSFVIPPIKGEDDEES